MDFFGKALGVFHVALLTIGAGALLVALGAAKEASLGKVAIKLPQRRGLRLIWGFIGLGLIAIAFFIAEPRWAPVFVVERVWVGVADRQAVGIASDGDDLYVLARNGNVWRKEPSREVLVDGGTATDQIEIAGGVLYVLKTNGNVWSVLLHERLAGMESPNIELADMREEPGRRLPEDDPDLEASQAGPSFTYIDSGTNTKSIIASGETLYVLKQSSGKLWRREVNYEEAGDRWIEDWREIHIDHAAIDIATSGSVLYYLSKQRKLRAVFPLPEAHLGSDSEASTLEEHVNAALDKCGTVDRFAVDGRKVYLKDDHGNAWVCIDGQRKSIFQACQEESVRELDAAGGIVYLLTTNDEIVRYAPGQKTRRFPHQAKSVSGISNLVATARGAFAIDQNGAVWRFSESLRKQE